MSSPITIVKEESMVVETSLFLKSMDTNGKSDTAKYPCSIVKCVSTLPLIGHTCREAQSHAICEQTATYDRCKYAVTAMCLLCIKACLCYVSLLTPQAPCNDTMQRH